MPNHKEHCDYSFLKYGKDFSELHKWMDEPIGILGGGHRAVCHNLKTTPNEAKKLFGEFADHACFDHIHLDMTNDSTLREEINVQRRQKTKWKRGRKKLDRPDYQFPRELWERVFQHPRGDFATDTQISTILQILEGDGVSKLFYNRAKRLLKELKLGKVIIVWLETIDWRTHDYVVIEKITRLYLEDEL